MTDCLDGRSVDQQTIEEVIAKNKDTVTLINRGIECWRCITPEVTGFDTLLPYISPWRNMKRVLAAKTRYDRLAGHYADAIDTCISLLKFADLIQQDAERIINYLRLLPRTGLRDSTKAFVSLETAVSQNVQSSMRPNVAG